MKTKKVNKNDQAIDRFQVCKKMDETWENKSQKNNNG